MPENPQKEEFWSSFYEQNNTPWQLPVACPPLFTLIDQVSSQQGDKESLQLNPGSVAVIGCGTGLEPIEFARRSFAVTAVDMSELAIAKAKQQAEKVQSTIEREINFVHSDIFALSQSFNESFDYVFEQTCFCAIDPVMRDQYVQLVTRILKPGGRHFGVFFDVDVESPPPFGVTEAEIRERFSSNFVFEYFERSKTSYEQRADREWLFCFRKRS